MIVVALLAGLLVLLLLFPSGGFQSDPPECSAMLFYVVPCAGWVAPLAGVATGGLIGLGLWLNGRRRQ